MSMICSLKRNLNVSLCLMILVLVSQDESYAHQVDEADENKCTATKAKIINVCMNITKFQLI